MKAGGPVAGEPPLSEGVADGGYASAPRRPPTSVARTLLRSTVRYLPGRVIPPAMAAVTIPLVATQLAPEAFGTFALVAAALPFIAVVVADWVIAGHQRYAHVGKSPQPGIWVAVFSTGAALCLFAAWVMTREAALLALALLLPPFLIIRLQGINLQMTGRASRYSAHNCTYSVLRSVLVVVAAYVTGEVAWVLAGWIAATVLTVLVGPRPALRGAPSVSRLRDLGRIGIPLVAASLALTASATADRFIIAAIDGRGQTGVYAFGYMIGEGVVSLPLTLPFLAAQYMATRRWDGGDEEGTLGFLRKVLLVQNAIGALVVLCLSASAGPLFRSYGPPEYASAAEVLVVVGSAQLLAGVAPYLLVVAALMKQTRCIIMPCVVTVTAGLVLTTVAVAVAGIEGAALATVAIYGIQLALLQRALEMTLLDRSSMAVIIAVTVAATCSAFASEDFRLPLLLVMCAASVVQCGRALHAVR